MTTNDNLNFLIYDNRSGSTYLSALINGFANIGVTLESSILFHLVSGRKLFKSAEDIEILLRSLYSDSQFKDWNIPQTIIKNKLLSMLPITNFDILTTIVQIYFDREKPEANCWLYKNGNPYIVSKIAKISPYSKFIFLFRDGRAVFASKKRTIGLSGRYMENDPIRGAKIWIRYFRIIDKVLNKHSCLKIKYEDFIMNPESSLRKIYLFCCGHEPDDKSVPLNTNSYFSKIPTSQIHMHKNVGALPIRDRIYAWKSELSKEELYLYEKVAYRFLLKMGYDLFCRPQDCSIGFRLLCQLTRLKTFFKRINSRIARYCYLCFHPDILWRKLVTRFDTWV